MWFSVTFTLHHLPFKHDLSYTKLLLFASNTSTCPMFCNIDKAGPSNPSCLFLLTQKFHWFSLWYIPLSPFPALKSKIIIKNAFLHLDKLLIIKMKSIYKISFMLVLWRQVMQMTGLLLGWQNEIYSLILCSYLVCGYGDVQIESPVLGN